MRATGLGSVGGERRVSPGSRLCDPKKPLAQLRAEFGALVWQYAQSPRSEFARQCAATYAGDNNCYAPGTPHSPQTFLDLNVSSSPDPSGGR